MDDIDDLFSLIKDVEQSAPIDNEEGKAPVCEQCDTKLDFWEGKAICPNCQTEATHLLDLDESELIRYGESGRAIVGQQAKFSREKNVDYGFSWSTDQAIREILKCQINSLLQANVISERFAQGVINLWVRFWLEYIAPVIRDHYDENDLIPWDKAKSLKQRDFEVLIKQNSKYFLPNPKLSLRNEKKNRSYRVLNTRFRLKRLDVEGDLPVPDTKRQKKNDQDLDSADEEDQQSDDQVSEHESLVASVDELVKNTNRVAGRISTTNFSRDAATILTLDRTLSFIEAAARASYDGENPIFATDLVRWCNYRILPFFGAHRYLPEGLKLNCLDRSLFFKSRSPTPQSISRAGARLLTKIYTNEFPLRMPRPDLNHILKRLIYDLNLPEHLYSQVKDLFNFDMISVTKSKVITNSRITISTPQYERLAFAILICHMKKFFDLRHNKLYQQHIHAKRASDHSDKTYFSLLSWTQQAKVRLEMILSFDPFVLFHPLTDIKTLKLTGASAAYVDSLNDDRPIAEIKIYKDERLNTRILSELSDFLYRNIPRPSEMNSKFFKNEDRDHVLKVTDLNNPMTEAFKRTKPYWSITYDDQTKRLAEHNFTEEEILPINEEHKIWNIYKNQPRGDLRSGYLEVLDEWPECFKVLLKIGAYLNICEVKEILREVAKIEDIMIPGMNRVKRIMRATWKESNKLTTSGTSFESNPKLEGQSESESD